MAGRGRGGRGESLRRLLEASNNEKVIIQPLGQPTLVSPSSHSPSPVQTKAEDSHSRTPGEHRQEIDILKLLGRGRGRGNIEPSPSPSSIASLETSNLSKETSVFSSGEPPKNAPSLERKMEHLSLLDKPPEIHRGTSGIEISVTANYIRLFCEPNKGMFEYFVRFEPEVDAMRMKYDLLNEHKEVIGEGRTFDGATLYLPHKLPQDETRLTSKNKLDGTLVNITVKFQKKRTLGECVHFYNILFRRIMNHLNLVKFNRSHFSPVHAISIPQHRLEVWPGFVTAVDIYEDGIMLCCDVSSRVLRKVTAYEIIQTAVQTNPARYKEIIIKELLGKSVMTDYNKQLYRIDDIDFSRNPSQTFMKQGQEISFIDYYYNSYGVKINDHKQPLLINRPKRKNMPMQDNKEQTICLVPELCYMTGLTDQMRSDFKVMKDINAATRVTPNQRQLSLSKFIKNMSANRDCSDLLKKWGLSLNSSTVDLKGRLLPPEDIYFGNNAILKGTPDADWGRGATNNQMLSVVNLQNWYIIHTRRDSRCCDDFVSMIKKVAPQMGMQVNQPSVQLINDDRLATYVNSLRSVIKSGVQIIVIIFPSSRDDRYSAVKRICVADTPVASQVIISRTITNPKKLRSVTQKIALQMNCKMGGTLWGVKIPFKCAMMCGIDTYHDPARRGNSWGGFVASMNESMTRWYSQTCQQIPGQELIDTLRLALMNCLKRFHQINGVFPETIVIFRDGVGDGQMNVCLQYELPQLVNAFQGVFPQYNPKLAFLVVQKRINTRIYLKDEYSNNFDNPPPGTIMDHTITRRNFYDFFIVSQNVRQGTVSPTHYVVLQNSTKFSTDQLQKLTYKMCHLYYNWPGTVRVPAPCQYAHKLAQLIGQNVGKVHSDVLSDKLFFL